MSKKKYIIFTDLKDFTYKNTLLTASQIQAILSEFHRLVQSTSELYGVKVLKSIGDAYFIISENALSAYKFSTDLLRASLEHDASHKLEIKKLSLRLTVTYGTITQNTSLTLEDYFGEAINL